MLNVLTNSVNPSHHYFKYECSFMANFPESFLRPLTSRVHPAGDGAAVQRELETLRPAAGRTVSGLNILVVFHINHMFSHS